MSQEEIQEGNVVHLWLGIAIGVIITVAVEFGTIWLLGWI